MFDSLDYRLGPIHLDVVATVRHNDVLAADRTSGKVAQHLRAEFEQAGSLFNR